MTMLAFLEGKLTNPSEALNGDAWAVLETMEGTVEAPIDWASNLNHYLYATPRRVKHTDE